MPTAIEIFKAHYPTIAATAPSAVQENPFFWEVIAAMQNLDELGGVDTTEEYIAIMRAIASEATQRAEVAATQDSGEKPAIQPPGLAQSDGSAIMSSQPVSESTMLEMNVATLRDAAEAILPSIWSEIEQRQHSGNDENWRELDEQAGRLARAVESTRSTKPPVSAPLPAATAALWDAASEALEDPDGGLSAPHRYRLSAAITALQRAYPDHA